MYIYIYIFIHMYIYAQGHRKCTVSGETTVLWPLLESIFSLKPLRQRGKEEKDEQK